MDGGLTEIVIYVLRKEISGMTIYLHDELYRVNLDTGKISKCPGGQMNFENRLTSMTTSGDAIYVIGNSLFSEEDPSKFHPTSRASYMNLLNDDAQWKPLREFKYRKRITSCAVFKGTFFVFGGNFAEFLSNIGEELCLTSKGNDWHFLPTPPPPPSEANVIHRRSSNIVSAPVLVDSKNNRILVHLANINSLYAYYPDDRKWDFLFCLQWNRLAGVFDDMILFHFPGYFQVYDLRTGTQLHQPLVTRKFPNHLLSRSFDSLIPLSSPGTFCLAGYSVHHDVPDITHLVFAKFCLVRSPHSGRTRIIFLSSYHLHLPFLASVTCYAPMDVVVSSKKDNVAVSSKDNVAVSSKDNVAVLSKKDNVVDSSKKGNVVFSSKIRSGESARGITFGTICF